MNFAEILPVAALFLITFTAFLLENNNFIAPDMVNDCSTYKAAFHNRLSDSYLAVIVQQQNLVKINFGSWFGFKTVHKNVIVLLYFKLLTCYFNDCVHNYNRLMFVILGVQRYKLFLILPINIEKKANLIKFVT